MLIEQRHQVGIYPRQQNRPTPAGGRANLKKTALKFWWQPTWYARGTGHYRHQPCHQLRYSANIRRLCAPHQQNRTRRQARQSAYLYRINMKNNLPQKQNSNSQKPNQPGKWVYKPLAIPCWFALAAANISPPRKDQTVCVSCIRALAQK